MSRSPHRIDWNGTVPWGVRINEGYSRTFLALKFTAESRDPTMLVFRFEESIKTLTCIRGYRNCWTVIHCRMVTGSHTKYSFPRGCLNGTQFESNPLVSGALPWGSSIIATVLSCWISLFTFPLDRPAELANARLVEWQISMVWPISPCSCADWSLLQRIGVQPNTDSLSYYALSWTLN